MKRGTKLAIPGVAIAIALMVIAFRSVHARRDWYEGHPISYWVAMLRSADPSVRARGADQFGHMSASSPAAVRALMDALGTETDADVHVRLAEALASVGPSARGAIPKLAQLARDEHPEVRERAVAALGRIGFSQVSAQLRDISLGAMILALQDKNHDVRAAAEEALGRVGPAAVSAAPELAKLAFDPISLVRLNAVNALVAIRAPSSLAVPVVTAALNDSFDEVRLAAANGLASFGESATNAIPSLERVLGSDDARLRRAAASALGSMGVAAASARARLSRALTDPDSLVREEAAAAIKHLAGPAARPDTLRDSVR